MGPQTQCGTSAPSILHAHTLDNVEYTTVMKNTQTTDIDALLTDRGARYGTFTGHAEVTISLKQVVGLHLNKRDKALDYDQLEALHMICHKIGRIINGDANYADSWIDIAGYAMLVANRLGGEEL